jgi:hypothetical protein
VHSVVLAVTTTKDEKGDTTSIMGSATESAGQLPANTLHESLPYYDAPLDADTQKQIDRMIQQEMATFAAPKLLKRDADDSFDKTEFLFVHREMKRVRAGHALPKLDTSRHTLSALPTDGVESETATAEMCDRAGAQLEHENVHVANLELLVKYGGISWKANATLWDKAQAKLEADVKEIKEQVEETNRRRKGRQQDSAAELTRLDALYLETLRRNVLLERECARMEEQLVSRREANE